MSSRSLPKLVSNSPDFISIDKTVVVNIDETYRRVIDACAVLEGVEALHWTDHDDDGQLNRIALKGLNGSLEQFHAIFDAIGIPGGRQHD